jgi:hypothetical protein
MKAERIKLHGQGAGLRRGARGFRPWLLLAGLFAAVFGLKVYLIQRFGTDLPFMDQWAKEGDMIIAPAREGTLRLADLLVPHSEHRILPTLALNLGLAQWAGQWDARVECIVNAAIHSAIIAVFVGYALRAYPRAAALASSWLLLGLSVTALDWENTLIGFQSEFYFVLGFSAVAIWGLAAPGGWTAPRWWAGLLCGGLAMVSLGSGLLCFIPVAAIAAHRLIFRGRMESRRETESALAAAHSDRAAPVGSKAFKASAATMALAIVAFAAGWLTRGDAPWDMPVRAKTARDFFLYFAHCLEWPVHGWTVVGLLLWAPWTYFAVRAFGRYTLRQELLLGAGLWVLLQIGAVSYYRGVDGGFPSSRYCDILGFGVWVNLLSWFEVKRPLPPRWLRPSYAAVCGWALILFAGSSIGGAEMWRNLLPSVAGRSRVYEQNVAAYLRTGDVTRLNPPNLIPFPMVDWFKRMIDRPSMRPMLPVSVRSPAVESSVSAVFRHFCAAGLWLALAGLLALLAVSALTWRRTE